MTKKSDAPAIRFKGFSDAWEQRKLSEITDKVTEKNAGLQYVETFTNSAEFGIISQRDFFDHDIAKLGSLDGYYIVKNEDFVYNPRISTSAPVGPINRNKLGRTGVMSPLYTVFRPHDIDTTYLEYFFKCGYWHSFMNFNGDSGARSDRFSIRDNVFFQMPIPIPDIDEQRKIGELLTCLDNLITLHQRKGKAAVSGCFLNCFSLEKSSAQSRTLELFGQISNQEIKYIIDGLSILGGKLRNFCVKLIILLSYTRINDIAKYHISRNTECVHNIN